MCPALVTWLLVDQFFHWLRQRRLVQDQLASPCKVTWNEVIDLVLMYCL